MRRFISILSIAFLSWSVGILALAEEPSAFGPIEKAPKSDAVKKDTSATAFALPKGVGLRKDQQPAYERLVKQYQAKLSAAVGKVQSTTDEKEKTAAAREVQQIRGEVKTQLAAILSIPDPAMIELAKKQAKAQQEMQKRWQQEQQQRRNRH